MIRVEYPSGRVHAAYGVYGNHRASVICNKVPSWHRQFEIRDESAEVTCPTCRRKLGLEPLEKVAS